MTLILIFLGWFILSSLWGFLPVIEPLRLFALARVASTFAWCWLPEQGCHAVRDGSPGFTAWEFGQ